MSIKKHFVSRFVGGKIVEADYSQLEVIVLAELSQDGQLKQDIMDGVDVHAINAKKLFGAHFTEEHRRLAKTLSFQLQYGSSAAGMAKSNNIAKHTAQAFIDAYYDRYPGVKRYHEQLIEGAKIARVPSEHRTKLGMPAGTFTLVSPTGRRYVFIEEDKWKTGETSFSTTKLKNYIVQGTATGDIVPMMLGEIYYDLKSKPDWDGRVMMINTVHDSIAFDVAPEFVDEVCEYLLNKLPQAPEIYIIGLVRTLGYHYQQRLR